LWCWLLWGLWGCAGSETVTTEGRDEPRRAADGRGEPRLAAGLTELPARYQCDAPGADLDCFDYVPGGTFWRGAQASDPAAPGYDPDAAPEEGPPREVTVRPFWMQRYELNGTAFGHCVKGGWCSVDDVLTEGPLANYGRDEQRERPINGITWEGAVKACAFFSSRLPTEAEWEFAARGTDGRRWPWGNEPGCGTGSINETARWSLTVKADDCNHQGTLLPRELRGEGPFKTTGLAGNVAEWVSDWYAPDAYRSADAVDPQGPSSGAARVQRGGGWTEHDPLALRSAARAAMPPQAKLPDVGVRCVWQPAQ
jgi:sulfatase modifying factor 1